MINTLNINGVDYDFIFGMNFLRTINAAVNQPVDGLKGVTEDIGLKYYVAKLLDSDLDALETVLLTANKTTKNTPCTRDILDAYIEDETTDIPALFDTVMGFLTGANTTKATVTALKAAVQRLQNQTPAA